MDFTGVLLKDSGLPHRQSRATLLFRHDFCSSSHRIARIISHQDPTLAVPKAAALQPAVKSRIKADFSIDARLPFAVTLRVVQACM
jgi:hypothetical protein